MELNLAIIHDAVAAEVSERECLVQGSRRLRWSEVRRRTRRLASYLAQRGLGVHTERSALAGWESGQDHLALYLYNCPEYLESMLGAFGARVAPFNVNYRYTKSELLYLLRDAGAHGMVYHARFAKLVAAVRAELSALEVLIQVPDDSGEPLLPGAVAYEDTLAQGSPAGPDTAPSPDDLYLLYTGGTTGMPKGVLWRQHDIFVAGLGGRGRDGRAIDSLDAIVARAKRKSPRLLATPPMMHGAAHWASFIVMHQGGTVVMQPSAERLDPREVLETAERERVNQLLLVGDAFGRPLCDELRRRRYHLSALEQVTNSGAPLHPTLKHALLELLPQVRLVDAVGASETGAQGVRVSGQGEDASSARFALGPETRVLDEDLSRVLAPGESAVGWLAQRGHVPLGYLGDAEKTARTFPVIDGVRYAVPGDRARLETDGSIELLGRDAATINTGGEKVYAEEVEQALKHHRAVYDAVVCGRPSERWGQEVCAIVQLRKDATASAAELLAECEQHLARYKLPKAFVFVDTVVRSPSGKADYRWARERVR